MSGRCVEETKKKKKGEAIRGREHDEERGSTA